MKFSCAHCGKSADRPTGHVNRSRAQGNKLYCGRRCSGLGRRKGKTKAQKKEAKRLYDADYRIRNEAELKVKRAAYFQATYDPKKARIERRKRAKAHAEYCRTPEYRAWKHAYDQRRTDQQYGPFAEAFRLVIDLNREIKARSTNYDIRQENQTGNKTQKREREGHQPARDRRDRHSTPHG
jgi:hypothetical protein